MEIQLIDIDGIRELLASFLGEATLTDHQLTQVRRHLELLLKWNARTNLTAVRTPEQMISRHFGESFFAAQLCLRDKPVKSAIDFGSGAGFPGIPLAIYSPEVEVTLMEAHNKKAVFLKEVVRAAELPHVTVFTGRAESSDFTADLVTLRAVEKFHESAPHAAALVKPGGRLALLIGAQQMDEARKIITNLEWHSPIAIPQSDSRVVFVGTC
jgi:16S rRNA (guanine527-N7)-methyltransferase